MHLKKIKLIVLGFFMLLFTSLSLAEYLHLQYQKRMTDAILLAPNLIFIEGHYCYLEASVFHDGMPSYQLKPLYVSWETHSYEYIPPDMIISKVWLINNEKIYGVEFCPNDYCSANNGGTINPSILNPYYLQRNASVVVKLSYSNLVFYLKDSYLTFRFVC